MRAPSERIEAAIAVVTEPIPPSGAALRIIRSLRSSVPTAAIDSSQSGRCSSRYAPPGVCGPTRLVATAVAAKNALSSGERRCSESRSATLPNRNALRSAISSGVRNRAATSASDGGSS